MSLYEENLAFIRQHNSSFYHVLTSNDPSEDTIEYFPASDNYAVERAGMRILLHSEYNREREFDRILSSVEVAAKTIILFGIGNGQLLGFINKRFPDLEHLVIIEPNTELMRCFLEKYDFEQCFGVFHKASFIVGKTRDEAGKKLEELVLSLDFVEKKITMIALVAYRTLYSDYYSFLAQGVLKAVRFHRVNKNTLEAFRLHWLINTCRNLKYVSPDIGVFKDAFVGMPAVIVSAGPSLQKNMHLLREVRNRALIIAVGSAISILDANGIVPHFRIAVDAAVENRPLFEKVDTSTCPLIYNDHLFYEIVPNYKGPKVHMTTFNNDTLISYIFAKGEIDAMQVRSGFSVANIAFYLLLQLRCSPIIFVGQDLCYTRGKLHAEGAWDEEIEEKYIKKHIETIDVFGNPVYTDSAFLGMKKIFEDIITGNPTTEFRNATEGGLAIEGAPNVPLAELLANELVIPRPIAETIESILLAQSDSLEEKEQKISDVVGDIEKDVKTILDYCTRIDKQYKKVYQMVEAKVKKDHVEEETRKLSNLIKKIDEIEFYARVIKPIFAEKFRIRWGTVDYRNDDWRKQWTQEIGLLRLEMEETWMYMLRLQALLEEYRGKRHLNVIFQ